MLRMNRDTAVQLLDDTNRLIHAAESATRTDPAEANAWAQAAVAKAIAALAVAVVMHADLTTPPA